MTYVLGVDGGNSKTLAVLGDHRGVILGVGRAGGSNHQSAAGLVPAMEQIRMAVSTALAMAGAQRLGPGWPAEVVGAAYYALAGADFPEDFALLLPALEELGLSRRVALNNDSMAALRSGTDNPDAVVVVLGAGTVGAGHNGRGQEVRLPSLGWISGDWGGGGDLAREAISLVARAHDGRGCPTLLEGLILRALAVPDADAMIQKLYHRQIDRERILHLAPLVFQAANDGDQVAIELVEKSGVEVVATATALLRRLDLLQTPSDVVLGGSIFLAPGSLLIETIRTRLRRAVPLARVVLPETEPVVGAFFCGLDLLVLPVDDKVRRRATESYRVMSARLTTEATSP